VPVASLCAWLDSLPEDDVAESSSREMNRALVLCRGADALVLQATTTGPLGSNTPGVVVAPPPGVKAWGVPRSCGDPTGARSWPTPQWQAAAWNAASRRVARRIGYREMGRQFSFQLGSGRQTGESVATGTR
jgi:hypothetical protein